MLRVCHFVSTRPRPELRDLLDSAPKLLKYESGTCGIPFALSKGMAILTPTPTGTQQVDWLHWLYIRGNRAISCDVDVRGEGVYGFTVLPLWSPDDQVVEMFTKPGDALRRHAELTRELQESGWLLVEGRPVTAAA